MDQQDTTEPKRADNNDFSTMFAQLQALQAQKIQAMKQLHAELIDKVQQGFKELFTLEEHYQHQLNQSKIEIQSKLAELQETISYTEEMSEAQRTMLNDAMGYAEKIEQKLKTFEGGQGGATDAPG